MRFYGVFGQNNLFFKHSMQKMEKVFEKRLTHLKLSL